MQLRQGHSALFPGLAEAAERACHGLEVTPDELINDLDPNDYQDIVADPALARHMAEQMEARR